MFKTLTILLITVALNVQTVVMPCCCTRKMREAEGGKAAAPKCCCCTGRLDQAQRDTGSRQAGQPLHCCSETVPGIPACHCAPPQRAVASQLPAPVLEASLLAAAFLPAVESPRLLTPQVIGGELLASSWQDDSHGVDRQARLSVWLN